MHGYIDVLLDGSFFLTFEFLLKTPQPVTGLFLSKGNLSDERGYYCKTDKSGH